MEWILTRTNKRGTATEGEKGPRGPVRGGREAQPVVSTGTCSEETQESKRALPETQDPSWFLATEGPEKALKSDVSPVI